MTYLRLAGIALVVALALYGGLALSQGARNLYADWVFLRAARIQAIQQAQQRAQQPRPAAPAPTAPQ